MEIKVGEKYIHFKGGVKEVIALGKHSETLEELVVYKHDDEVWIRLLSMFLSKEDVSKRPDNITGQKYRFEKLED